ncbi:MAG: AMP-binding protein, partial [Gammaproteobacteria bacterium]|nr:AMP-binding protein [Gammaproteobacteria bacterium]
MSAISPNVSLPELFRLTASQYPNQVAINFSGTETSFSQLNQLSDQVAAGLAADGIVSGDHIALYCVNSDVFVIAYMGILKAGATV